MLVKLCLFISPLPSIKGKIYWFTDAKWKEYITGTFRADRLGRNMTGMLGGLTNWGADGTASVLCVVWKWTEWKLGLNSSVKINVFQSCAQLCKDGCRQCCIHSWVRNYGFLPKDALLPVKLNLSGLSVTISESLWAYANKRKLICLVIMPFRRFLPNIAFLM